MRVTPHHSRSMNEHRRPASFGIEITTGRTAATVRVAGEIDAASCAALGDALIGAGTDGREVLLDLGETTFIDSAGIRVLVRSMLALQEAGPGLRLIDASPTAENILRITAILDVLKDPAP